MTLVGAGVPFLSCPILVFLVIFPTLSCVPALATDPSVNVKLTTPMKTPALLQCLPEVSNGS